MGRVLLKVGLAVLVASGLLAGATAHYRRTRTPAARVLVPATACFLLVALVHVCEALHLFPAFGWGQSRSVGHYIDLAAALGGVALVVAAVVLRRLTPTRSGL